MKKIEPVAWIERHELLHIDDSFEMATYLNKNETYQDSVPLWTDDALQAVAEAVLIKLQEEISKRQILNDETPIDRAYNRGLDAADAIVGDFDVAAIINRLKGK